MESEERPFIFRLGENGTSLLREVCFERGWRNYDDEIELENCSHFGCYWDLWWTISNHPSSTIKTFNSRQFTNRSDKNFSFTSKDICTRYIRRLKNTYGEIYNICPISFNVPSEYCKLCKEHTNRKSKAFWNFWDRAHYVGIPFLKRFELETQPIWICKPVGSSQGKGISIFDNVTDLRYTKRSVVQEYITKPFLIGDYKWDLRMYVCIVSLRPLVIYAYKEGLVRFATNPFTLRDLKNPYVHLTNSSLNKLGPNYTKNKNGIGLGCKWTLSKLRQFFYKNEICDWILWQKIVAIFILTIIGDNNNFNQISNVNTFSLLGFDILIDRQLKPFLIEVNSNPSLTYDCEVDRLVKKPLLHDLFDLLNLPNKSNQSELSSYSSHTIKTSSKLYDHKHPRKNFGSRYPASVAEHSDTIRNWKIHGVSSKGNWIRIFPFKIEIQDESKRRNINMSKHFIKHNVHLVEEFVKVAERIGKLASSTKTDIEKDITFQDEAQLNTQIWHPALPLPIIK